MKNAVIVGAGVNGLTIGYELARNGLDVTVLEKEKQIGGLARTFRYGNFSFDIGPHRFHTEDPEVMSFIKKILGNDAITILRSSGVYIFEKYHDWPIRSSSLLKMPLNITIHAAIDLMLKRKYDTKNFEGYIKNKYGKTLYEKFFADYTRKFVGIEPSEIHYSWAETGLDRAIIDKRVKMDDLGGLLKSSLMPKPVKTEFIYPENGIDVFCKKIAEEIEKNGGSVITNSSIGKINTNKDNVTEILCNGEKIKTDTLVWTAPVTALLREFGLPQPDLSYVSLIIYNIETSGPERNRYQWCYYGEDGISFSRISQPSLFSKKMAPDGMNGLCVEISCRENDNVWKNPESMIERIKEDLVKVKAVERISDIMKIHIERIANAYPAYKINYPEEVKKSLDMLKFKNLKISGRCGLFWYNNMDHSIKNGLEVSKKLLEE